MLDRASVSRWPRRPASTGVTDVVPYTTLRALSATIPARVFGTCARWSRSSELSFAVGDALGDTLHKFRLADLIRVDWRSASTT